MDFVFISGFICVIIFIYGTYLILLIGRRMTLKEQLEILRGEPIKEKAPIEAIPCIETSDAEKLCKHPVVSVNMITYNHEPYIRQAIEGVMMQQTDFEFELVIGEDASQDKTREICFEYQKKYPDKIRVLWSDQNVNHLGGNGRRVMARCRGEFIALCEGDDYWTDALKLQKQVDIMRAHPDVGLCFSGAEIYNEKTGKRSKWNSGSFPIGEMKGETFFNLHIFGAKDKRKAGDETFIMTATTLFRMSAYYQVVAKYEVFNWRLLLGDTTLWLGLSASSNVYFLNDVTSLYRKHEGGICMRRGNSVGRDATIVRFYYLICEEFRLSMEYYRLSNDLFYYLLLQQSRLSNKIQKEFYLLAKKHTYLRFKLMCWRNLLIRMVWRLFKFKPWMFKNLSRYLHFRHDTIKRLVLRSQIKMSLKGNR